MNGKKITEVPSPPRSSSRAGPPSLSYPRPVEPRSTIQSLLADRVPRLVRALARGRQAARALATRPNTRREGC